jgi:AcrB/AcrD/AcrF family/Outer membrane efflux protein
MWIVRLALNRPYTFIVAAILIVVLGVTAIAATPTDIFANIDIPVVTLIWSYSGLPAKDIEQRVTTFSEFVLAVVNDIKAIDSQMVNGASVIKISFQPQVRIDAAMSQMGAAVNSIRFRMPPGVNPPWIFRFSASTVPIVQLSLSSDTFSESELYDYGIFRVRQQLSTVPGTLLPAPYGGVARQIMVDLDQDALLAKGITPIDVTNAINAQNVTLPSGTAKIGSQEFTVSTNSSPRNALALNDVPVKTVNGSLVYMRDIGHVRDGWAVQQNSSRTDGNVPELRRQIASDENALSVLLGRNPGAIERGLPVAEQPHPDIVPVGVPSQLLERRPDIQQAEAKLIAANARIGVARAQFFPQISLTGLGGSASSQLTTLFAGQNAYWYVTGSLTQPIFEGGRIRNNYRLSEAQRDEMVLEYRKTILNALQDASSTLVAYQETRKAREEQFAQVTAAADSARLARLRYSGGNASYLEVVTDMDLYAAQLLLVQAQQPPSKLISTFFPSTSVWPGLPRRRDVVELVDIGSPEFHKVQPVRFYKLLNLKMLKKGDPLSPRWWQRFQENSLFPAYFVSADAASLFKAVALY